MDQADTLRRLMQQRKELDSGAQADLPPQAAVMTISSGKGGVGKTCLAANLGAILARSGLKVLLVDGDMGLANLDIILGVQPTVTLEQVLAGEATIQDAVLGVEPNLWLVPAASGLMELRESDTATRARILHTLEALPWEMDVVLMDLGAGIQDNVLSLHSPLFNSVVALTPEPTSLTDAYGLIKLLRRSVGITKVDVVVNQVTDAREAQAVFQKLKDVASRFVDVQLEFLGHVNRDEKITQAVMKRKILLDLDPGAPSIACMELLAKRMRTKFLAHQSPKVEIQRTSRALRVGFKDEPAPGAPGNTARFFRTLLGEVKA